MQEVIDDEGETEDHRSFRYAFFAFVGTNVKRGKFPKNEELQKLMTNG